MLFVLLYDTLSIIMSKSTQSTLLPRRAQKNLSIVGEQIRLARLRRDISIAQIADRAGCSEQTVMRVEKGTPSVAIGTYLRILFALNLDEDILLIAQQDTIGRELQDLSLKKRQRASSKRGERRCP